MNYTNVMTKKIWDYLLEIHVGFVSQQTQLTPESQSIGTFCINNFFHNFEIL